MVGCPRERAVMHAFIWREFEELLPNHGKKRSFTMIELRVLGEIRLRTGDGAEIHTLLRQPKRLALLAYLASPTP